MNENESMSIDAIETMLEEQPETTWYPMTASQADWCIKMINDVKAEKKRIDDVADEEIEILKARKMAMDEKFDSKISFFTSKLRQYFEHLDDADVKETKTQYKHTLLNGALVMTKAKTEYVKNDDELVSYLERSGNEDFVKIEKKPAWGEFKKRLSVIDGNVIDKDTGEIVDCVSVSVTEERFEVKA